MGTSPGGGHGWTAPPGEANSGEFETASSVRRLSGRVSADPVRACGSSTTRCRVAGGEPLAVAAGCSAFRVRCTAAGVTPRVATMSGMDTSATIPNRAISRSGLGSVAISAGSRARCSALTRRWLCSRESVVAAGAGWTSGKIGGGATDAPTRTAPPPGPAAVPIPRPPTSGSGCRPLDPVGPWPTGVRIDQPTSARHARWSVPGQLADIEGIPARPAISDDRGGAARRMTTPGRLVLGACRRTLVAPGSRAGATDSSRKHRASKPVRRIEVRAETDEEVRHGPR